MQPIKLLTNWLAKNAKIGHCLFTIKGLAGLYPDLSNAALKTLLSRAVKSGYLEKICRGVYLYSQNYVNDGRILFHTAALLRADDFNYISLETALSDAGVISQVPINHISIMSSGRSSTINCGKYGTIEFIHTMQKPEHISRQLFYDQACKLWRANIELALRDMKATRRNLDLLIKE
jgi:predicted transcriptional regulator of viral defense system